MKEKDLVWLYDGSVYHLHYRSCASGILGMARARKEWLAKWPNYCQSCDATGVHIVPGSAVPYGLGYTRLPDDPEPCPECVAQPDIYDAKCPRCGCYIVGSIFVQYIDAAKSGYMHYIEEFGPIAGTMEAWFDNQVWGCPVCDWSKGAAGDDFFPGYGDGCICYEWHGFKRWWYEIPPLGILQRFAHKLAGTRFQGWWTIPVVGSYDTDNDGRIL